MAEQAAIKPFIALDASIFDDKPVREEVKLDVQYNRIRFEFPAGFADIDFLEECRALKALDNFDLMYDISMQMLVGKPLVIKMKSYEDEWVEVTKFQVTDRYMNLRGVDFLNAFPIVVVWLTEFIAEHLSKKYPLPSRLVPAKKSNEEDQKRGISELQKQKTTARKHSAGS